MRSDLRLYHPCHRVYVSISLELPKALGFLDNPSPRPHAVDSYSGEILGEWTVRYSVPELRLSLSLGSYYSPGYFGMQSGSSRNMSSQPDLICLFHRARFGPSQ